MLKVALTGGIATGKTYVVERFRRLGVPCLESDRLGHGAMAPGTEATQAISARFGAHILNAAGGVDRKKLGPLVFADPVARRHLEAIVHPPVYRAILAGLRAFEVMDSPVALVDIPLLYETDGQRGFDRVIATLCSVDSQIARLVQRGLSEAEAGQRLAAQMPAEQKAARADFVIRTDGAFEETDRQVDETVRKLTT